MKRLSARFSSERLRSLQRDEEISPERFRPWRFIEVTELVAEQVIPVQLQWCVCEGLDQVERAFFESSMAALNEINMSSSVEVGDGNDDDGDENKEWI